MDKLQCQIDRLYNELLMCIERDMNPPMIIEKPKKINVSRVEIDFGYGKFIELTDKEYEEVIFWNEETKQWDANSIRLILKK